MNTQEKIDAGFDVRKIPETKPRKTESKKVQNPYAKKYMENKKTVVIKDDIMRVVNHIKDKRKFSSTNETLKFLLDLEKDLSKMNMIKEFSKCPDCGAKMSAEHVKKVHNHVDSNVECFGCMQKSYQVMLNEEDTKKIAMAWAEQKKKQMEQNEQKEQKDANKKSEQEIDANKKSEQEIDEKQTDQQIEE